jgi:Spy/CpxP family protein refolding chaperone
MSKYIAPLLFAATMFVTPCGWAEGSVADVTDMQALRAAVKTDKRAFVASVLNLTDAEGKKFWPIYDAYQRGVDMANRDRTIAMTDLIGLDKPLSEPFARTLAKELIAADEAEIKARRTLQNKLMKALPIKKAARYLQLESKIRAAQAYDIAVGIPLIR